MSTQSDKLIHSLLDATLSIAGIITVFIVLAYLWLILLLVLLFTHWGISPLVLICKVP